MIATALVARNDDSPIPRMFTGGSGGCKPVAVAEDLENRATRLPATSTFWRGSAARIDSCPREPSPRRGRFILRPPWFADAATTTAWGRRRADFGTATGAPTQIASSVTPD